MCYGMHPEHERPTGECGYIGPGPRPCPAENDGCGRTEWRCPECFRAGKDRDLYRDDFGGFFCKECAGAWNDAELARDVACLLDTLQLAADARQ